MDEVSLRSAESNLSQLIQQVSADNSKIRITSDKGSVILISEETYNNLLITLEVFSTPGLAEHLPASGFEME